MAIEDVIGELQTLSNDLYNGDVTANNAQSTIDRAISDLEDDMSDFNNLTERVEELEATIEENNEYEN